LVLFALPNSVTIKTAAMAGRVIGIALGDPVFFPDSHPTVR